MKNFSRAERNFVISSTLTAILFIVIARLQFWGIESGIDVPLIMPTVVLWTAVAWVALMAYCVAHRLVTTRQKAEVR